MSHLVKTKVFCIDALERICTFVVDYIFQPTYHLLPADFNGKGSTFVWKEAPYRQNIAHDGKLKLVLDIVVVGGGVWS